MDRSNLLSPGEFDYLFRFWMDGSLDSIHSQGCALPGVRGLDRVASGFRPQTLLQQFTVAEVSAALLAIAQIDSRSAALLVIKHGYQVPIEDCARALACSASSAQGLLLMAQALLTRELHAH